MLYCRSDVLLTREQQQAVIAGQTRADDLFDAKGVTPQPRDEFFLPNGAKTPIIITQIRLVPFIRSQGSIGLSIVLGPS